MRNKKIGIILISIASTILVSCSTKVPNEDKVIDTMVIDENAKETAKANDSFDVIKLQTTENIRADKKYSNEFMDNGKILHIDYSEDGHAPNAHAPKLYINSIEVGTITYETDNNRNKISWDKIDIEGQLLTGHMDRYNVRILKDNKVYMLDNNSELKEIKAYEKLIKDTNGDLSRFASSYDGDLDIYNFYNNNDIEKIVVIDTRNDKYDEIKGDIINSFKNKSVNISCLEDEKIYVTILDKYNKKPSTIGYIEDNKLYTFFDDNSEIKIEAGMNLIYSNNNLLFSGYVEDNYGYWRYDIGKKELYKEVDLKDTVAIFDIDKDKEFVRITNIGQDGIDSISMARISENLEITNIKDITDTILSSEDNLNGKSLRCWIDSNKFYVECGDYEMINNEKNLVNTYYEVYEVVN